MNHPQESTTSEIDDLTTSILESTPDCGQPGGRIDIEDDRIACIGTTVTISNINTEKTTG